MNILLEAYFIPGTTFFVSLGAGEGLIWLLI